MWSRNLPRTALCSDHDGSRAEQGNGDDCANAEEAIDGHGSFESNGFADPQGQLSVAPRWRQSIL